MKRALAEVVIERVAIGDGNRERSRRDTGLAAIAAVFEHHDFVRREFELAGSEKVDVGGRFAASMSSAVSTKRKRDAMPRRPSTLVA